MVFTEGLDAVKHCFLLIGEVCTLHPAWQPILRTHGHPDFLLVKNGTERKATLSGFQDSPSSTSVEVPESQHFNLPATGLSKAHSNPA